MIRHTLIFVSSCLGNSMEKVCELSYIKSLKIDSCHLVLISEVMERWDRDHAGSNHCVPVPLAAPPVPI